MKVLLYYSNGDIKLTTYDDIIDANGTIYIDQCKCTYICIDDLIFEVCGYGDDKVSYSELHSRDSLAAMLGLLRVNDNYFEIVASIGRGLTLIYRI